MEEIYAAGLLRPRGSSVCHVISFQYLRSTGRQNPPREVLGNLSGDHSGAVRVTRIRPLVVGRFRCFPSNRSAFIARSERSFEWRLPQRGVTKGSQVEGSTSLVGSVISY